MAKVLGIGGVFIKTRDPKALAEWYQTVLGLEVDDNWFSVAFKPDAMAAKPNSAMIFSLFNADTDYIEPSKREFMINLCVDNLAGVLERCAEAGVVPTWRNDDDPYGKFAHILDPEGTKIELWEPPTTAPA